MGMPSTIPMGFRQRYEYVMAKPVNSQIWVWDGRGHNDMRKSILPYYKGQRSPMAEDIFAQINLFKKALTLSHAIQVTVDGWEADDVIATLTKKYHARGIRPRIHSNDIDYGQLADIADVVGVNMKETPAAFLPLRKAMVGKSSDHMKGIPGFGPKTFTDLAPYWSDIQDAIRRKDKDALARMPFKPKTAMWLQIDTNLDELEAMLRVAWFFDVPEDEIFGGWKVGTPDRNAAHALMNEFFL